MKLLKFFSLKGFSLYPNFRFINKLIKESERQKQRRQNLKNSNENVWSSNKEAANVLKSLNQKQQGRPCIDAKQPDLVSTIVKLVQNSTAADKRKRTECLCSIRALDDLHKEIAYLGIHFSRSALYLCLLPFPRNTSEGKHHVHTVPVKLLTPENSLRKK